MRVMQGIIREHGLHGEYSEALQSDVDLAQDWWPGPEYEYPEDASDSEDPEKKARDDLEEYKREVADKEYFFPNCSRGNGTQVRRGQAGPSRS